MYATMWRIRLFEQKVLDLYKAGSVRGTSHPYMGMEAVAVGSCAAIGPDDYVTSTHRGHGHCLAKGLDPGRMMAELLGRADGYCKGKGGSMHVACPALGLLGADAVVGASPPIAGGAALAARLMGEDRVVLCYFGDGASNEGVFFEALNLAVVLKLPIIFICENNLWALTTPVGATTSVADIATRADGFGLPGLVVDGQDALAVYQVAREAVERARAGGGPTLIECKTYRFHSHSALVTRDPRPRDEVEAWLARDPIHILGDRLSEAGIMTQAQCDEARATEQSAIDAALEFAQASPEPAAEEAYTDVFAPSPQPEDEEPGLPESGSDVRRLTLAEALNEAMAEEMRRDARVFVIGEDVAAPGGLFHVTRNLLDEFGPDRVIDAPVAEAAIAGFGVGAALAGARAVAEIQVMDFLSISMDQIANHAAKLRYMTGGQLCVPLVVRGSVITGCGLAAQHGQSLEAWVAHIPGLKVIMPSTPYDAKGLLKSAIRDGNPVICFEKRLLYDVPGPVPEGEYMVPLGKAAVRRPGQDVTIVASGLAARYSLQAAQTLAKEGIDAEVIDLRTLVPLDADAILASVSKTHRVVVANDGHRNCGFAAEIMAMIMERAFDQLDAPVVRVACDDVPVPYAAKLEQAVIITAQKIAEAVRKLIGA
ncbi:MAG: hypothetical protein A2147_04735 [Chloroflexi bacterium RBG_16_57_8]|nr:MAG: hypothetical protein A2147_04735 [Chloroflexi bacterium RBG_16_57_8]